MDYKFTSDLMQLVDLSETIDQLAKLTVTVGMDMYWERIRTTF